MRILEMCILGLLSVILLGFFLPRPKRASFLAMLATLVVMISVAHWFWEKPRWQMAPGYIITGILFILTLADFKWRKECSALSLTRKIGKFVAIVLGLVLLAITAEIATILHVPRFPKPTGPYLVGTTKLYLTDAARAETFTEDSNDIRKIMVQVWYPADPDLQAQPVPYWQHADIVGPFLAKEIGLPRFFFNHLALIRTNSYQDAPIAKAQPTYPVVAFSCGYGSLVNEQTLQMEELASHGYVVFSLAHTYETLVVIYPDGQIVPASDSLQREFLQTAEINNEMWKRYFQCPDEKGKETIAREILQKSTFMDKIVRVRTADIRFVMDELEKMNSGKTDSMFSGRLDLSRSGIFGHSMGGAVAGQICLVDNRFDAGINLDGFQFGDMLHSKMEKPFMMMYCETFRGVNDFLADQMRNTNYVLAIGGSTHMNYSDNPFILPITQKLGAAGTIEPLRMREIVNNYVLAFFDKHLKGQDSPLLNANASPYTEVTWKVQIR